jgi:hypothetical protein
MPDLDPIKQIVQIDVKESGVDEAAKGYDKLQTNITETTAATAKGNAETKKTEEGFKSLKLQLKEAILLQQKMSQQYGATSAEAIKATKAVAGIKYEIGFQKDLVASYNPDEKFRKLTQTAGVAALALGGVKEGFTALGIESKTIDKIIGSAQAILGVTSAVAGMSDAYAILTASKKAKSAADVVEAGTTEALVVVEGQATAATWSWNAALLANPIVLITAGIAAAIAVIYAYVKITGDAVKEEEKAKVASMQLSQAIDQQSKAFENNSKFAERVNKHKIDLLRASGASEAQIYKETKALAEQELQLAKNFRAEATLAEQKAYEANRDNPTEFNAETLKNAKENLEKAKQAVSVGYDGLIDLQQSHEVSIEQAKTDARKKAQEDAEKARQKEKDDQQKANDKAIQDKKDYLSKANAVDDEFANLKIEKEQKEKERLQKEYDLGLEAQAQKAADELAVRKNNDEEQARRDKAIADQKKKNTDDIMATGEMLIEGAKSLAGKNKSIQKAAIITEGAVSLGKVGVNIATGVSKDAASGAVASVPQIIKTIATGALSTASIISNTARALKAVGGGGSISGGDSLPTRNVAQVGFQGSSENQISSAISQQQKNQPPIQAFVVSQAMTDQQELDRKKELANSF